MKLISSSDTLQFLCKSAPRPWVKRMLKCMIIDGELDAYFALGRIIPATRVFLITSGIPELINMPLGPERNKVLDESCEVELATSLYDKLSADILEDDVTEWGDEELPHHVSGGFFIFANEIDWEAGILNVNEMSIERDIRDIFFWDSDDHLGSQFRSPEYNVKLGGLCFPFEVIEMMLPNMEASDLTEIKQSRSETTIGRPRKWDWEGAFGHLAVAAQHPDGLPTGPGSQAKIERIIADWFIAETGDCPATSQIRQRAQKMHRLLSVPKTG